MWNTRGRLNFLIFGSTSTSKYTTERCIVLPALVGRPDALIDKRLWVRSVGLVLRLVRLLIVPLSVDPVLSYWSVLTLLLTQCYLIGRRCFCSTTFFRCVSVCVCVCVCDFFVSCLRLRKRRKRWRRTSTLCSCSCADRRCSSRRSRSTRR